MDSGEIIEAGIVTAQGFGDGFDLVPNRVSIIDFTKLIVQRRVVKIQKGGIPKWVLAKKPILPRCSASTYFSESVRLPDNRSGSNT